MRTAGLKHRPSAGRAFTYVGKSIALVVALPLVTACGSILDIAPEPHTIDANRPVFLAQAMVGATSDLYSAYDTFIAHTGLFTDEFFASSLDGAALREDLREVNENTSASFAEREKTIYSGWWLPQHKASVSARLIQTKIEQGEYEGATTDSPEYARAAMYEGFAKTWIADAWCTAAFDGEGPEYTSAQVYELAEQRFTAALGASGIAADVRNASLVGRARVRLMMNDEAGALADAALVPPDFELLATYSTSTIEQNNRVWWHNWGYGNISVDYRAYSGLTLDETGIPDPRVDLVLDPIPAYDKGQPLWAARKVAGASSPLVIASGDEAQFIMAEIQGGSGAVDIINAARARHGITVEWSPAGGDPDEIRDKVIDERRRTLFLEGTRMGDLRRYVDKFDVDHFPATSPQGDTTRGALCYPLPLVERANNPGLALP
jgi:hypothetical protein